MIVVKYTQRRVLIMTNKNKKLKVRNFNEVRKSSEEIKEKERKYNMLETIIAIITIGISVISLVISIIAVNYSDKEYEYKLSPEIELESRVLIKAEEVRDEINPINYSRKTKIKIINKNNLDKAYLIHPDNSVEKLNINEFNNTIEENFNENIRGEYDLEIGEMFYQYRYILLIGLDGSFDLYLVYLKTDGDADGFVLSEASGVEIWGLINSNKNNPEFDGERIMAEQYKKILAEISYYIGYIECD